MSKALILTVDTVFNNPDAPYLSIFDPIENRNGSIYLWDAGKQTDTTVLGNGNDLPNLLDSLNSIANGKSLTQVKPADTSYLRSEKTTKGGLHLIASQAKEAAISGELFVGALADSDLLSYLYNKTMVEANPNIYISIWSKITRAAPNNAGKYGPMFIYTQGNTNNFVMYKQSRQVVIEKSSSSTSVSKTNLSAIDNASVGLANYDQVNLKGYFGSGVSSNSRFFLGTGTIGPYGDSFSRNNSPSYIVYRVYIEDLNLSGRTFAEVKAIDDAEFEKAFAVGGRFYNDTWSDPATILP